MAASDEIEAIEEGAALPSAAGQGRAAGTADTGEAAEDSHAGVRTLLKSLSVLEAIGAESSLGIAEIARRVGLNRTTTYRIVQTLLRRGYVQAMPDNSYAIGLKILPIAAQHLDNNRVRLAALPQLNALAQQVGERVNLGVHFEGELLYIAGIEKPTLPNMYSRFGHRAPLHCCSLGKAIVAFSEPQLLDSIAAGPLVRHTPNTIWEPERLRADILETRRRGYAIDNAEHLPGTFCIAAPILNPQSQALAAIGVSGNDLEKTLNSLQAVRLSAEIIGHMLASEAVR
jgi:DNA-binding IclR family transcriptional regulator